MWPQRRCDSLRCQQWHRNQWLQVRYMVPRGGWWGEGRNEVGGLGGEEGMMWGIDNDGEWSRK